MLNIVVPMAGRGSRFGVAGYTLPKPLIPVHGIPMVRLVIQNLLPAQEHRFLFLCLKEHLDRFPLTEQLNAWAPGCAIIPVETVTEGAACTVLLARDFIDNNHFLMIANSDQWVDVNIDSYLNTLDEQRADGLIMTMWADDPKWSYIRLSASDEIVEVVEKRVVSNEATVGIYNFRRGRDFVSAADSMIAKNLRVNNEFYVAPCYNEMIEEGKKIVYYNVGREYEGMYGLGIPDDLEKFMGNPISQRAILTCG